MNNDLLISALTTLAHGSKVPISQFSPLHQSIVDACTGNSTANLQSIISGVRSCLRKVILTEGILLCTSVENVENVKVEKGVIPSCILAMDKFLYRLFKGRSSLLHMFVGTSVMQTLATREFEVCLRMIDNDNGDDNERDNDNVRGSLLQIAPSLFEEYYQSVLQQQVQESEKHNSGKSIKSGAPTLPRHRFTRTKNKICKMPHLSVFDNNKNESNSSNDNSSNNDNEVFNASMMKKIELPLEKRAFIIENVLNRRECEALIQESLKVGYSSIETEFQSEARDNQRALILSDQLAQVLWQRIRSVIEQDQDIMHGGMRPFGFDAQGKWKPIGLNSCFRFCAYFAPCIGFVPHRDANFVQDVDHRSIFTCMIYLNEEFEQGTTNFLKSATGGRSDETVKQELERGPCSVVYELRPKTGMAIVFDHLLLHEGSPVPNGNKFIARTDLVFERYENPWPNRDDYLRDPTYMRMVQYYKDAADAECHNNVQLSSDLYEKALSIRQNHVDTATIPS